MTKVEKNAISPTREQDFPEWYQQVIRAAELAEPSDVRGCMVIRPWGYAIWERLQQEIDNRIKAAGAENVYFEIQANGVPEQDKANEGIVRTAKELGRPLVGTASRSSIEWA